MNIEFGKRHWFNKFSNAIGGIVKGTRGQSSFLVHLPSAVVVAALAVVLKLDPIRFSILLMCIAAVITAELFNSSIERLAKAVSPQSNQEIGDALDIASGAVLCIAICSAVIGIMIMFQPILQFFSGN